MASLPIQSYVIGDVHGCVQELGELERQIRAHAGSTGHAPRFICVGDLVDRGPLSRDVVEHVRLGVARGEYIAVGGNHEACLVEIVSSFAPETVLAAGIDPGTARAAYASDLGSRFASSPHRYRMSFDEFRERMRASWLEQGGADSLLSYGCDPDDVSSWSFPPEHIAFLYGLPLVWEDAALVVTHGLPNAEQLLKARELGSGRYQPDDALDRMRIIDAVVWGRDKPPSRPDPARVHVSGHTPLQNAASLRDVACVRVDTGCAYGNRLSAWCAELDVVLSVGSTLAF